MLQQPLVMLTWQKKKKQYRNENDLKPSKIWGKNETQLVSSSFLGQLFRFELAFVESFSTQTTYVRRTYYACVCWRCRKTSHGVMHAYHFSLFSTSYLRTYTTYDAA